MEKEEGRGGEENKQPPPKPPPPQPQQHHKCPRCDSLNTKFCYYNNYSLSQPRYFCKACKRYWTQGGTLRNIPVGGSRKGKRGSSSSIDKPFRSQPQQPTPPPHEVVQNQPNLTLLMRPSPPTMVPSTSPYYHGGGGDGYLSSLAPVHSLNASQPFNQSLNYVAGSTSLGVVSGFNTASLGSQHHQLDQIRSSRFYQTGNRGGEVGSLCPAEQGLIPSRMGKSSASSQLDQWPHSFMNDANHSASDASLWSTISTTSISGNSESNIGGGSSSLVPNHWPDLPGSGPPQ